jgi:hypothetical protein
MLGENATNLRTTETIMTPGRPPLGAKIVRHLDADSATKQRLEILLQAALDGLRPSPPESDPSTDARGDT